MRGIIGFLMVVSSVCGIVFGIVSPENIGIPFIELVNETERLIFFILMFGCIVFGVVLMLFSNSYQGTSGSSSYSSDTSWFSFGDGGSCSGGDGGSCGGSD